MGGGGRGGVTEILNDLHHFIANISREDPDKGGLVPRAHLGQVGYRPSGLHGSCSLRFPVRSLSIARSAGRGCGRQARIMVRLGRRLCLHSDMQSDLQF